MATSDAPAVRQHCLAVAQVVLPSAAALLLFVGLHDLAVTLALEHGRSLRDGVGWGLTVQLALFAFAVLALLQSLAARLWPARRARLALAAWVVFAALLTLLADPFGSWSHPMRYLLLQCCAAAGFALSLAGQQLWTSHLSDPRRAR
jgi:peptidoglycan/LPS O-acetylase OafA/YrhL